MSLVESGCQFLCSQSNVVLKTNTGSISLIGGRVVLPPDKKQWEAPQYFINMPTGLSCGICVAAPFRLSPPDRMARPVQHVSEL